MRSKLALLALTPVLAAAQTPQLSMREIAAARIEHPPAIDGKLDDTCWKSCATSSGFSDDALGALVKDDTTVWIGYDDQNIYVAFHCHDSDPKKIVAKETRRGSWFKGEDRVRFRLNPFNSMRYEDLSELNVNPLGTQYAEFAGGRASKQEWEGVWQSASQIADDGWTCEIAVPWRCFVRPSTDGRPRTRGVNFERYQARTQVFSYWSNLGMQERLELGGRWTGVVLPPTDKTNPLSILGYTFGGVENDRAAGRTGFDARYQATPLLTGVGTVNPDFSSIEGAVTTIDFSYTERLADERRPFFLEGANYYSAYLGGYDGPTPFASIRVPQFDVGGKMYGRVGNGTDVGLLAAHSVGDRTDAVVSVKQQLSPFASLGGGFVSLRQADTDNRLAFGSGRFRTGDWSTSFEGWRSFDRTGDGEYSRSGASWSNKAWWASTSFNTVSRNLTAPDGYVPYTDQRGVSATAGLFPSWRHGTIRGMELMGKLYRFDHYGGGFFRDGFWGEFSANTDKLWMVSLDVTRGRYEENRDHMYSLSVKYPWQDKFRNVGLTYAWGRQGGSGYGFFAPTASWRFINRLQVGVSSEVLRSAENDQQDIVTVSYELARDRAIGGRLVRRNGLTNWYLSFRRSGYGGTEYFAILGDPNSDTFTRRLVFKVVRQF